ncbi:hypothetical protein F511_27080 [Dorcoceras hygrometricum]|uniref:Uncharacterized protein n=1 Tax=Dorcoceras hygrometricum TaxID=472368 RepID=A0A2Z7CB05_9LAMI|nr:hypothetical protein F511_27080 [Dorcoceras hygrometricum]
MAKLNKSCLEAQIRKLKSERRNYRPQFAKVSNPAKTSNLSTHRSKAPNWYQSKCLKKTNSAPLALLQTAA